MWDFCENGLNGRFLLFCIIDLGLQGQKTETSYISPWYRFRFHKKCVSESDEEQETHTERRSLISCPHCLRCGEMCSTGRLAFQKLSNWTPIFPWQNFLTRHDAGFKDLFCCFGIYKLVIVLISSNTTTRHHFLHANAVCFITSQHFCLAVSKLNERERERDLRV